MAHFAKVDQDVVSVVYVLNNKVIEDEDGNESERMGQEFLADLYGGEPEEYIQCSYNGSRRGVYPGPGYRWDGENFLAPGVDE